MSKPMSDRAKALHDCIETSARRAHRDLERHDPEGTRIMTRRATKAWLTRKVREHFDITTSAAGLTKWMDPNQLSSIQYKLAEEMAKDAAHKMALDGYFPTTRVESRARELIDGLWKNA